VCTPSFSGSFGAQSKVAGTHDTTLYSIPNFRFSILFQPFMQKASCTGSSAPTMIADPLLQQNLPQGTSPSPVMCQWAIQRFTKSPRMQRTCHLRRRHLAFAVVCTVRERFAPPGA
jgi:hypothetical protein